jgi:hypothetical protein
MSRARTVGLYIGAAAGYIAATAAANRMAVATRDTAAFEAAGVPSSSTPGVIPANDLSCRAKRQRAQSLLRDHPRTQRCIGLHNNRSTNSYGAGLKHPGLPKTQHRTENTSAVAAAVRYAPVRHHGPNQAVPPLGRPLRQHRLGGGCGRDQTSAKDPGGMSYV